MNERDETTARQEPKPGEGVRILKAEEAQAALDAGEAAGRRPDDQLRFGDVPPAPTGPRPVHRFPLPDSVNPAEAVSLPPLAQTRSEGPSSRRVPPPGELRSRASEPGDRHEGAGKVNVTNGKPRKEDDVTPPQDGRSKRWSSGDGGGEGAPVSLAPSGSDDRTTELALGGSVATDANAPISLTSSHTDMLHWTDPPTGEVPRLHLDDNLTSTGEHGDDFESWKAGSGREAHWRDERSWYEEDVLSDLAGDEPPVGALDSSRSEHSDLYSFDEDFERVRSRTGPNQLIDLSDHEDDNAVATSSASTSTSSTSTSSRSNLRSRGRARVTGRASVDDSPPTVGGPEVENRIEAPVGLRGGRSVGTARKPGTRRVTSGGSEPAGSRTGPSRVGPSGAGQRRAPGRAATATGEPRDDLRGRALVGGGLVVALIVAYAVGSKGLVILAGAVCVVAAAEAYRMVQGAGFSPATLLGLVATAGCVLGAYWKGSNGVVVVTAIAFAGTILWYVLGIVEARPLVNVAVTIMVFVWVGVLGSFAALLLRQSHGKGEFLGAVLVAVAADIGAYFVGRAIGSRPLAPSISPGKTLEGYLGGVIAAIIVGAIVGKAITPWGGMRHGLVLGLLVGLIAPAGDLFESLLKRDLMLKDSGTILGGHGGVLDRFDALLLALPAAYFVVISFKL